jgi:hypothetical protein
MNKAVAAEAGAATASALAVAVAVYEVVMVVVATTLPLKTSTSREGLERWRTRAQQRRPSLRGQAPCRSVVSFWGSLGPFCQRHVQSHHHRTPTLPRWRSHHRHLQRRRRPTALQALGPTVLLRRCFQRVAPAIHPKSRYTRAG